MISFLLYIARGGLYLGLFFAFYLLVMRRTTFFRLNRAILLAGSYICLLLPVIRLRTQIVDSVAVAPTMVQTATTQIAGTAYPSVLPWPALLLAVLVTGGLVILVVYLCSALKMLSLTRKGTIMEADGCRLVLLDEEMPSFSWRRCVVMSRKDWQETPVIFTHERMHVKCRHSRDLLLFLPLQMLFWWNPLVWITREELRLLHEYEADEGVIQQGVDAAQYQLLLVRKAVGEQRFILASGFQHAKLKYRISMMVKPSSSSWMRLSYLALIPILAALMVACNPSRQGNLQEPAPKDDSVTVETTDLGVQPAVPYQLVEVKPTFRGGDANEFSKWVNMNLHYPQSAIDSRIEGRIKMSFSVDTDGSVTDVRLLQGIHPYLDREALRVVNSCTEKWTPGLQDGKPVKVTYVFPIIFKLK